MRFRLPKIPVINEKIILEQKIILERKTLEDDENQSLYEMQLTGILPERLVKTIYNYTLKPKLKQPFQVGLPDNGSIVVPTEFFKQKAGFYSWQETILMQLSKHFHEVNNKLGWIFITRNLNLMRITRKGTEYHLYMEVTGEKSNKIF